MGDVVGEPATAGIESKWRAHADATDLVVTFFGAYDTGKSSLIRRLLAERDVAIPEWLTVTARHETYETRSVRWGDVLLQDTPGIGQGTDERIAANTQKALEALLLSDLLIVTLPPQLMTSEREVIKGTAEVWANQAIAFAVGRFDEAGADPESDPDDYEVRSREKAVELRRALQLPGSVPIFVLAADPFGLHSSDVNVDSGTWVAFKVWDGVDAVEAWIDSEAGREAQLRAEGERRYWYVHLADRLDVLTEQLETTNALLAEATKARDRREWHDRRLDSLASAARSSLDGVVEEAVRASALSWQPGGDVDSASIELALGAWYDVQRNKLLEHRDSVIAEATAQRERPIIKVILGLDFEAREPSQTAERIRKLTPQVQKVLAAVRDAAPKQQARAAGAAVRSATASAAKSARKGFLDRAVGAISIAEGVVGPAGELMALLSEEADRQSAVRDRARQREQLRVQIRTGCRAAADMIFQEWESDLREVSDEVNAYFDALADSSSTLLAEGDRLTALRDHGNELKVARASNSDAGSD